MHIIWQGVALDAAGDFHGPLRLIERHPAVGALGEVGFQADAQLLAEFAVNVAAQLFQ
jgi:hypothetical protein